MVCGTGFVVRVGVELHPKVFLRVPFPLAAGLDAHALREHHPGAGHARNDFKRYFGEHNTMAVN
jgi:hypothetical protein